MYGFDCLFQCVVSFPYTLYLIFGIGEIYYVFIWLQIVACFLYIYRVFFCITTVPFASRCFKCRRMCCVHVMVCDLLAWKLDYSLSFSGVHVCDCAYWYWSCWQFDMHMWEFDLHTATKSWCVCVFYMWKKNASFANIYIRLLNILSLWRKNFKTLITSCCVGVSVYRCIF